MRIIVVIHVCQCTTIFEVQILYRLRMNSIGVQYGQCSRLKPSYEFHLKGSQFSALQLKRWFKSKMSIKNIEMKYKTHIKLVHELYGTCFMYNVKN